MTPGKIHCEGFRMNPRTTQLPCGDLFTESFSKGRVQGHKVCYLLLAGISVVVVCV